MIFCICIEYAIGFSLNNLHLLIQTIHWKGISYLSYRYGSILIDCKNLTETIDQEIKQWISVYGKAMQIKYKREMDFIVAQVIYMYSRQKAVAFEHRLSAEVFCSKAITNKTLQAFTNRNRDRRIFSSNILDKSCRFD